MVQRQSEPQSQVKNFGDPNTNFWGVTGGG